MTPPPSTPPFSSRRLGWLAALAFALAWGWMCAISAGDRWYRNVDMNAHNIVDALCLNSGIAPVAVDQPDVNTKYLLALHYRLRDVVGQQPVWTVKRFARCADPLREFAGLVEVGRQHSRVLVMGVLLALAGLVYVVTRRFDLACFALILNCGGSGLLFHGLLTRPELLAVGFGLVLATACAWLAAQARSPGALVIWLFLAGLGSGLAVLSKLPAWFYFVLLIGAWLAHRCTTRETTDSLTPPVMLTGGCGVAAGLGTLALLWWQSADFTLFDPIAATRMRLFALCGALFPIGLLWSPRTAWGAWARARVAEIALLVSGFLAAFLLAAGLLRLLLPVTELREYYAKVLAAVFHPEPLLAILTQPAEVHRWHEFTRFMMENPLLVLACTTVSCVTLVLPHTARSWRFFIGLMLTGAFGMAVLMSKRGFFDQYTIFLQVPLLLAGAVASGALLDWWQARAAVADQRWPGTLALTGALTLALIVPAPLAPKFYYFQTDDAVPVSELTITLIYDHDVHPRLYLEAMKHHYPTREDFARAINLHLATPENRH